MLILSSYKIYTVKFCTLIVIRYLQFFEPSKMLTEALEMQKSIWITLV